MANTRDLLSQRFEAQRQKLIAMDIVAVASSLGLNLKQSSSGHLYWDKHDSFHIYPETNSFRWWSRGIGTNTIDLVQVVQEDLTGKKPSFRETVTFLETGHFEEVIVKPIIREPFKHYLAPYEHENFDLGRQYLKEERGLSDETIDRALASGSMSSATLKKGDYFEPVIIFKSFAEDGRMIGGSLQGIVENKVQHPERGRLKQIMKHSDGLAGFHLDIGTPKRLVFTEAPIDLLSYYEIHKDSLQDVRLVAMDGVKKGVISRYTADLLTDGQYAKTMPRESIRKALDSINQTTRILKDNPNLLTIAVDNDEAGRNFIKELQEDGIPITVDLPPRKEHQSKMDWNDYLKQEKGRRQLPQVENIQTTIPQQRTYEEIINENKTLIRDIENQIKSRELSIDFDTDVYLYDVFRKLGNSHPLKYINEKRLEVLTPIQPLLASIDDKTVDAYKEKGTAEQNTLYQALKPHQRTLGVDVSTRFIGELAIAAYNTNRQLESLSTERFGAYYGERTLDNLSQSIEGILQYPLIESEKMDFTYGFVTTPNTFYHYLEKQKGEVLLNWSTLEELKAQIESQPLQIIEEKAVMKEDTQKAPEQNLEHEKKIENPIGDLPERTQEAAPLPNALSEHSLDEPSPTQTQSQSLLHFTISEPEKSIYKQGYHPISTKELNKLNRYASQIQENASWYQSELADSQVTYFYKNENQLQALQVSFKPEHYPHLIGLFAINESQTAAKTLTDLVEGNGNYQNIMIANRGATFSKIQVLPDFKAVIDANSFIFDDLSEVERMNRLDLAKAIRTEDRDVLIAFRNVDGEFFPASLMKVTNKLESDLSIASNKAILAIISEKNGQVNVLSINNQYITDGGQALKDMIVNRELEPIQTENLQSKVNQKINYPKDSDGDGLTDDEEFALGINPFSSDSDGDGTPDGIEKANGTDPTNASDNEMTRQKEANQRDLSISEMIKAKNTEALNQHLQEGIQNYFDSDAYKQYLEGMAHFNNYSPRNIQLIVSQLPEATMVASFNEWKKRNGSVKKGEKAIYIQAPVSIIKKDENGKPILNPETGKKEMVTFFKPVPVFDISQVSPKVGKELTIPKAMEDIPEQLDKDYYQNIYRSLRDISQNENNVPIRFRELGQEDGFYSPQTNEIVIKKGMSYERTLSTLIHEMAHSELHNKKSLSERFDGKLTISSKELQAESIAYVVSNHLGFDTSQESFPYLASWSREKDGLVNLTAQLEIVQAEAKSLMERIDHQLAKYQRVTLDQEAKQTTKEELKKQTHPFYQSLVAAKTSTGQVSTQEKDASIKKDKGPTMP
ncbi:PBECR4 domain-containing protein [Streptococcus uberis]|uniref:PBECR4 domain-containing protein n=1 Tax=Streptococcus uberis TaxID=1349 RepID=UPI003D7809EE